MALTQTEVSKLYVALFGRASEGEGNDYWQNQTNMSNGANSMLNTQASQDYFGSSLDTNQAFIEFIYSNTLNKTYAEDSAGVDYWTGLLDGGQTRGEVVSSLIGAIDSYSPTGVNYDSTNTATVNAYDQFTNRVDVSNYTADTVSTAPDDYATSLGFNEDLVVTHDDSTITTARASVESINTITGVVSDGYIYGAEVFSDENGDGIWNEGESKTTTDESGNFTLENATGVLIATGGSDVSTGLEFEGIFTAPDGSTTITPITTLIDQLMQSNANIDAADAESQVAKSLGLDDTIDLLNFDSIAAASSSLSSSTDQTNALQTQAAAVQVMNMMNQAAAMIDGAGIGTEVEGALAAVKSLADMIFNANNGGVEDTSELIDLASEEICETFLHDAVIQAGATEEQILSVRAVLQDIGKTTANINTSMFEKVENLGENFNPDDILKNLVQDQIAAEDIENEIEAGTHLGNIDDALLHSQEEAFDTISDGYVDNIGHITHDDVSSYLDDNPEGLDEFISDLGTNIPDDISIPDNIDITGVIPDLSNFI